MGWQEAAIDYTFSAGQDYLLRFRSATPGAQVATTYQRVFWGDGAGQDLDLGLVTIRDGREGYNAENWTNVAFPRMRVTVEKSCYPDCTGEGELTVADFGCFQGKYVLGDLYADCNQSGDLTVADFGCFQGSYVLGCP